MTIVTTINFPFFLKIIVQSKRILKFNNFVMNSEKEEKLIEDKELREHSLSWIAPLAELESEADVEPLPISDEKEQELLQGVKNRFNSGTEMRDSILSESLELGDLMDADLDTEVPQLSDEKMETLMKEVRKQFGGKEKEAVPEIENKKIISIKPFLIPASVAAAAAVVLIGNFGVLQVADDNENSQNEEMLVYTIELGDWEDEFVLRGGTDEASEAELPSWVKPVFYNVRSERTDWLNEEKERGIAVKVWINRDQGKIMMHYPGTEKPETVELVNGVSEKEQLLKLLNKLKQEFNIR